jgi:SMC interacting uncharacterized protein involved in chromosome segregation
MTKISSASASSKCLPFLCERRYKYHVSVRSLSRLELEDFTNITTFMLRLTDNDFQSGGMKFDDKVALNFKALGYRFLISKTALVAAGSPASDIETSKHPSLFGGTHLVDAPAGMSKRTR